MGGEMPQKERIKEAYALTRKSTEVTKEELNKIETVIYTMADVKRRIVSGANGTL